MRHIVFCISVICLFAVVSPRDSEAQWVRNGNPVCAAHANQYVEDIISDGAGGIIVVWSDERGGEYSEDLYIQRIDSLGTIVWNQDGVPACTTGRTQERGRLVSDGAGGVIVVWGDDRDGPIRPYAQRFNLGGNPLWSTGGVPVGADTMRGYPDAVSDGAGGVITAFSYGDYVYAQRLGPDGNPVWNPGGVRLATNTFSKGITAIASDGSGGAIVTWQESFFHPDYSRYQIFAQHVTASGNTEWGFLNGGIEVSYNSYHYNYGSPSIAGDGMGGSCISWSTQVEDVLANRLTPSGSSVSGVLTLYTGNDVPTGTAISSDGSGGAIVVWAEPAGSEWDLHAMRIGMDGTKQWPSSLAVTTVPVFPRRYSTCEWSQGGILATWEDERAGKDVYVQAIDMSGNTVWDIDGLPVCTEESEQLKPLVLSTAGGRAFLVWRDSRGGDEDIYAMIVHPDLHFPGFVNMADTSVDVGDTLTIRLAATDPDPEDTIVFSTNAADVLPTSFGFSPETGLFNWAPQPGDEGYYSVIFRASDGFYMAEDTMMITVTEAGNRIPVIEEIEDQYVYAKQLLSFTVSVFDPDYDEITLYVDDPRLVVSGSTISWQTYYDDADTFIITVTASDGALEDSDDVAIYILPCDPSGPIRDFMVANVHPFFDWSGNLVAWSPELAGCLYATEADLTAAIVSGTALDMTSPVEVVFRFRTGASCIFGFTTIPPWKTDYSVHKVELGLECIGGVLYPSWAVADYWGRPELPEDRIYDCRLRLDQSLGTIEFSIDEVDSITSPLSDFMAPEFAATENVTIPDYSFLQANIVSSTGECAYYDIWLAEGDETATTVASFGAFLDGETAVLWWRLSDFVQEARFDIEQRTNPDPFFVSVHEPVVTGDGINFEYIDNDVEPGTSRRYRVYLLDEEGRITLFETTQVDIPAMKLMLHQNFPNPFNPSTTIGYYLPEKCHVILGIYDVSGKHIATLADESQGKGRHAITWNGHDQNGNPVSSGTYFYRLKAGKETVSKKMILLK